MKLALAVLVLGTSLVHAEPPPAIQLTVRGTIDRDVLATSIASELGRPVAPLAIEGSMCAVPCLSVVVGDGKATVLYSSEHGARQRTITLGDDAGAWPTTIMLLAGNLVRDEASEVLPLVAPKPVLPAPAIVPPVVAPKLDAADDDDHDDDHDDDDDDRSQPARPAAPRPEHWSIVGLGLVPGLSTDFADVDRTHMLSIAGIVGIQRNARGLSLSGVVDVAHGEVSGAQISGTVAVAGDLTGVQLAGAAAVAEDAPHGLQIGGAVAHAMHDGSMQFAGAVTSAGHDADTQVAGAVAVAGGSAGLQVAGAVAVANGNADVQITGAVGYARDASVQITGGVNVAGYAGVQISGGVNVADELNGVQVAPINIANSGRGVQIGVLNIGGDPDGASIGLINIVHGGRTDLEGTVDSDRLGTVLFRHGSRHWHNTYAIGGQHVSTGDNAPNDDVWMYGLGFGPSFHIGFVPIDVDLVAYEVNHGARHEDQLSLLGQLRLTLGIPLGGITIVAGGEINAYVSNDHMSPFITARTTSGEPMTDDVTVKVWPSLFVGARL